MFYRGKRVAVIAQGPEAVSEANFLAGLCSEVIYFGAHDDALDSKIVVSDKKPEAIRRLDLKTGRSAPVATGPIEGTADFILYGPMIVAPGMTEKKIHIMPIGGKK